MGFDKNDPRPIPVTVEKKTTKVNLGVIVGVLLFLLLGVVAVVWISHHPHQNAQDEKQKIQDQKSP